MQKIAKVKNEEALVMRCSSAHASLIRKLYTVLDAQSWRQFCRFHRSLAGRFSGEDFSQLSLQELEVLSSYATRSREEAVSSTVER